MRTRPMLRAMLGGLLMVAGLATPLTLAGPAQALTTPTTVTRGVTGYGTVSVASAPDCTSSPANPAQQESDCTPLRPGASSQHCTSDGETTECTVSLTASTPDPDGWAFDHWSGDCSGTATTCTLPYSSTICVTDPKPLCSTDYQPDASAVAHFVDTRPPTITFSAAPAANSVVYSDTRSQQFTWTSDESAEGVTYTCLRDSGTWFACSTGLTWSSIPSGVHTLCVRGSDASGLLEQVCRQWEQETYPTVTVTAAPDGTVTDSDQPPTFTWTSNEAGRTDGADVSFVCWVDGVGSVCSPGSITGPATNGDHSVRMQVLFDPVIDVGTGRTADATRSWTQQDDLGPAFTLSGPSGARPLGDYQATWSGGGAHDTVSCDLDGTSDPACTSPYALAGLGAGRHVLTVTMTDPAGNRTTHRLAYTMEKPPACRATLASRRVTRRNQVKVQVRCNQRASTVLTGKVRYPRHGRTRTSALSRHTFTVKAGVTRTTSVRLPSAAVSALRHHRRVKVWFGVAVHDAYGRWSGHVPWTVVRR